MLLNIFEFSNEPPIYCECNTKEEVIAWLKKMNINNYEITDDLIVNVKGNVNLMVDKLVNIPVQFGDVTGEFNCSFNSLLISLKGSPKSAKSFTCSHINIETLEYLPQDILYLNCSHNQIKTLDYLPSTLKSLDCSHNQIKELKNLPNQLEGNLFINNNQLTSLKGSPKSIKGNFICSENQLTSLEFGPVEVNLHYDCSDNKIKTIENVISIKESLILNENPIEKINVENLRTEIIRLTITEELKYVFPQYCDNEIDSAEIPYSEFKKYKLKLKEINDFTNSLNHDLVKNEITSQRKI